MRLVLTTLCLSAVLLLGGVLTTPAAASISDDVRRASSDGVALGRGAWNKAAETALVDRIDQITDEFHRLSSEGAALSQTAAALLRLVTETQTRYSKALDAMQAEVIRLDGDLEAVQDSSAWQDRELLAVRLRYRENWIRYEIAMRYERSTAKRAEHLRKARDGFSEFLGSGERQLEHECRFGRGLAQKSLKEYDAALKDFKAVLADSPSPDLVAKIRSALAETTLASGRISEALDATKKLLGEAPDGEPKRQAVFLRAKALLLAVGRYGSNYGASAKATFRAEAARSLEQLYKSGSYWKSKAVQLIDAGVEDPSAWTSADSSPFVSWLVAGSLRRRGECAAAVQLYRSLLARNAYTTESHYGVGFCAYHEGDFETAAAELTAYLEEAGETHSYRYQAAYLRFKAGESNYFGKRDDEAAGTLYLEHLKAYLEIAPEHQNAHEAWFRLGEWHRDRQDFEACAETFGHVASDSPFRIKASFLAGQCLSQRVLNAPEDAPASREAITAALTAIDAFLAETSAARETDPDAGPLLAPMEAKGTVMAGALAGKVGGVDGMQDRLERLRSFEERFADERDLYAEVLSLRIVAHRTLGDLDSAGAELERLVALPDTGPYQQASLKKLGIVFLKEASKREEADDLDGAARARRVALTIYERLLADSRAGKLAESPDGLEKLIADLKSGLEEPEALEN